MTVVVDASAMFEVVFRTPTGAAVLRRLMGEEAGAPDTMDAEVASAVRRLLRAGGISESEAAIALDRLVAWPGYRISTRHLLRATRRWWPNVSVYDALYLAVAVAGEARVLTCDGRLARAPGLGVPVEDVRVT